MQGPITIKIWGDLIEVIAEGEKTLHYHKQQEVEYRCAECEAEFTPGQAGSYCSECGHDYVVAIEDWEEFMGDGD
jgi:DNA-directed RNA polymerase subunit RPC12/RpoP